jgi:hypothetical protein
MTSSIVKSKKVQTPARPGAAQSPDLHHRTRLDRVLSAPPSLGTAHCSPVMAQSWPICHGSRTMANPPTTPSPSDVSHITSSRTHSSLATGHSSLVNRLPTCFVHRLAQNHRVFHHARQTPHRHALHRLPLASSGCCSTQARARLAKIK